MIYLSIGQYIKLAIILCVSAICCTSFRITELPEQDRLYAFRTALDSKLKSANSIFFLGCMSLYCSDYFNDNTALQILMRCVSMLCLTYYGYMYCKYCEPFIISNDINRLLLMVKFLLILSF